MTQPILSVPYDTLRQKSLPIDKITSDIPEKIEEIQDSRDGLWLKQNEQKFKKSKGLTDQEVRDKYHLPQY